MTALKHKIKTTIIQALNESGTIIRRNITKRKKIHFKGTIDLLTTTDKKVEKIIIRRIKEVFPSHAILAEEAGAKAGTADYKWIIDPLDGTTNFAHSMPHIATSIGVECEGTIIAGGVYDPIRNELFYAEKGRGAYLNGKRIHVSSVKKLAHSLLVTGFPYDRRKHADYYLSFFKAFMMKTQGTRRLGTAALDFCYIASGRLDGFWEFKLHPWDVAAGALIVEEAGGKVTDFSGKKYSIYGQETLATNSIIHTAMQRVIARTA